MSQVHLHPGEQRTKDIIKVIQRALQHPGIDITFVKIPKYFGFDLDVIVRHNGSDNIIKVVDVDYKYNFEHHTDVVRFTQDVVKYIKNEMPEIYL